MVNFIKHLTILGVIACIFPWLITGCATLTPDEKLKVAIDKDDLAGIQRGITDGANVNSVLFYAVKSKKHEIVNLLLDKKADPNMMESVYEIQGQVEKVGDNYFYRVVQGPGKTPLWHAIAKRDRDMVKILLDKGASVDREYKESSASACSGAVDLVNKSTGVIRQAYLVKSLKDSGLKPTQVAGVISKDGTEVAVEGRKWTDSYIREHKLKVADLRHEEVFPGEFKPLIYTSFSESSAKEDVREGYILCNVAPHEGGPRTTLMDFAKSTGDAEIIRMLSEALWPK